MLLNARGSDYALEGMASAEMAVSLVKISLAYGVSTIRRPWSLKAIISIRIGHKNHRGWFGKRCKSG